MGKIVGQTMLFNLGMATNLGEGKLTSNLFLKIDLVLHPVCVEGLVHIYELILTFPAVRSIFCSSYFLQNER